ncbi:MAG: nucleotidyltransferase domain-containing protein [Leptospiraceae bacterium]|nr:nucleotidyltransferase domain-containing protein [Leptospiraceae bacterium]
MQSELIRVLTLANTEFASKGLQILGYFGSFARGDERADSDLDILYELQPEAYRQYPGWSIVRLLEEVRQKLENELQMPVDLVDKDSLREVGNKYILPELIHVA